MSALREATNGATTASVSFSSAIGTPNLPIRGGAAANTINRCNSAGGKTRHAARKPHGRSGSDSALQWLLLVRSAFLEIFWVQNLVCAGFDVQHQPVHIWKGIGTGSECVTLRSALASKADIRRTSSIG